MMKEKILRILSSGGFISGEIMASSLGVSRNSVWKAVESLRREGYSVESVKGRGYRLKEPEKLLKKSDISWYSGFPEDSILIFRKLQSTNDYIKQNHGKLPSPSAVIAGFQTAGRGRFGRSFYSPEGQGLYMSIFFREPDLKKSDLLTLYAALAVTDTLREMDIPAKVKWVNDIYIDGKKAGGILTEAEMELDYKRLKYIICGIGLNIYTKDFPENIENTATSIASSMKSHPDINLFAGRILGKITEYKGYLEEKNFSASLHRKFMERYNQFMIYKGEKIVYKGRSGEEEGTVKACDTEGNLVIEKDGTTVKLRSGEFTTASDLL